MKNIKNFLGILILCLHLPGIVQGQDNDNIQFLLKGQAVPFDSAAVMTLQYYEQARQLMQVSPELVEAQRREIARLDTLISLLSAQVISLGELNDYAMQQAENEKQLKDQAIENFQKCVAIANKKPGLLQRVWKVLKIAGPAVVVGWIAGSQ